MKDMAIRVLHVLGGLATGGTENLIMNWYRSIDKTKVQFDFLVRSEANNFIDEIKELGGKVYFTSEYPKHFWKNYKETKQVLEEKKWDVIHIHGNALIYVTAIYLAKKYDIPCRIMHSHSVCPQKNIYKYIHYFNRLFFLKHVNTMLACSSRAGEWMFGRRKYEVLENGLSIDKYYFDYNNRKKIQKEFGINENFVVGHVGRFTQVKNHEFLLEIFSEIKKIQKESILLLVGEGSEKNKIQAKAENMNLANSVIFAGARKDVGALMSAMDCFVFPSIFEGLGNVLIEAQINGLNCFVNKKVITKEVEITDKIHGISLENEPEIWAENILSTINRSERKETEKKCFDRYDIKNVVRKLTNIYEQGAKGKNNE